MTAFGVLVRQLRNPLLILLLAAAAISAATGDTDRRRRSSPPIVILSVGLGFVNEYRSEVAVAALHANIRHEALVRRDGARAASGRARPRAGRRRGAARRRPRARRRAAPRGGPARVRRGRAHRRVDAGRPRRPCRRPPTRPSTSRRARSWAPSSTKARARAVVVATGSATAFGKIAVGLGERQAETAFQVGLRDFSKLLVRVAGGADHLDLRHQRRAVRDRCSRRCCSRWPSPSASRRSCCPPSSA